jgi:hypothetical protein
VFATLAVWQGVPYLFANFITQRSRKTSAGVDLKQTAACRGCLIFLAGPPLVLIFGWVAATEIIAIFNR